MFNDLEFGFTSIGCFEMVAPDLECTALQDGF
jgi:hypothetical protein